MPTAEAHRISPEKIATIATDPDYRELCANSRTYWKEQEWRTRVARRLADATSITDACGIPSQIKILPPPLLGGFTHTLNIHQAVLEEKLPYDFELPVQKVADVVDQTVFACERLVEDVRKQEITAPSPLEKVPGAVSKGVSKGFGFFFKTDFDRSLVKWLVVILLAGLILRFVFGLPVEKIGEMIIKAIEKHT